MQRLLITVLALAASTATAAELRLIGKSEPPLETFELGQGHRVRISPDGSRVETEIGVIEAPEVAPGKTVIRRTYVGSNVNIATGTGAVACTQVGDRQTCVVNRGNGSKVVEGEAVDLDPCFGAGGIGEIIACAERQIRGRR